MDKLNLTLLLPGRMDELFALSLSYCIEKVIWHQDEEKLEKQIRDNDFDIALEWQYGHDDHTVLNLVKKYNKNARVILCLNWNGDIPDDFEEAGYFDYMDVPLALEEMRILFERAKRSLSCGGQTCQDKLCQTGGPGRLRVVLKNEI